MFYHALNFKLSLKNKSVNSKLLQYNVFHLLCGNFFSSFTNALWDLSSSFSEDPTVMANLNRMIHSLQEMNKFHSILLDQASRTVLKNLSAFIKM